MSDVDRDIGALEARLTIAEDQLREMNAKLDCLLAAAAMGRGAWWAMLRMGGVLVLAVGAIGWLWDHVKR